MNNFDEAVSGEVITKVVSTDVVEFKESTILQPVMIRSVNEAEAKRFKIYAEKHWKALNNIWSPISLEKE